MNIDNKDIIHMKCNACGHDTLADQQEKLYNFILNHPPPKQMIMEDIKKKEEIKTTLNKITNQTSSDFKVEWSEDFSEEAVKRRREEEGLSERIQKMTLVGDEKEEEPSVPPNLIITEFLIEKKRCK